VIAEMNSDILKLFAIVGSQLDQYLVGIGLEQSAKQEWARKYMDAHQRLRVSIEALPRDDGAYIEVFPGVNFPAVEKLAASLQDKKPRKGLMTCSINIGLLSTSQTRTEWRVASDTNANSTASDIVETVRRLALPFWNDFTTLASLLDSYDENDFRLCRGSEWPWRHVAAACLCGSCDRAIELLQRLATERPACAGVVEEATRKVLSFRR
jgi:hypothetical protein